MMGRKRNRQVLFLISLICCFALLLSMTFSHSNSYSTFHEPPTEIANDIDQNSQSPQAAPLHLLSHKEKLEKNGKWNKIQIAIDEIRDSVKRTVSKVDLFPEKTIFVVASWRTGSTFLGQILESHPAVYYNYEPLASFEFQNLTDGSALNQALETIESLSNCEYQNAGGFVEYSKNQNTMMKENNKIHRACVFLDEDCFSPKFLNQACLAFPVKLFKTVRLRFAVFERFIQKNPNVHAILLVRDPRAIFASRQKLKWCLDSLVCSDLSTMCESLQADFTNFKLLEKKYPAQVHLLKFEDLAMNPVKALKNVFLNLLGISWHTDIELYLEKHTKSNLDAPWSTFRVSRSRVQRWKETMEPNTIKHIQNKCHAFLTELNYSIINTSLCNQFC